MSSKNIFGGLSVAWREQTKSASKRPISTENVTLEVTLYGSRTMRWLSSGNNFFRYRTGGFLISGRKSGL